MWFLPGPPICFRLLPLYPPDPCGGSPLWLPPPPLKSACALVSGGHLDVKESNVFGVALDEVAAVLDVLAHQDREDLVGDGGVLEPDLEQGASLGVHGGLPQLVGVHLAEALVPLRLHVPA